jgi:hypothetical protein
MQFSSAWPAISEVSQELLEVPVRNGFLLALVKSEPLEPIGSNAVTELLEYG